ncbi:ABC-type amino acid transporter [Didymella exigua CBS 183.55]|uniref:ABC-type amino acid transporter n=1 Tax=Didymella exigua CBS 183.55 TaxID=1150837 RepID=A0A6A5R5W9_9PLEO|nr:ABC-type amino acid transporter [Didymella exigua CBS 183.55]KAF1923505.1 ABC-type amino acid transporter [Didymella exigua CBS 183.55]
MINPTSVLVAACLLISALANASRGNNEHEQQYSPNYLAPASHSNNSILDKIQARGYLKVGTTGDYKPFSYRVTNRTALPATPAINTTYIGADIDLAQSLSNSLGLSRPVEFVPTVWANLSADIAAQKFDIAMSGVSITLARAQKLFFSTAIQRVGKAACVRCADLVKFSSLAAIDTAGVKVAVNPGGTNEAFDRANLKTATIVLVQDNNAVYKAVMDGGVDAMISDIIEVELQVRLHPGVLCIVNPNATFTFEELGYMVDRDIAWKQYMDLFVHVQQGNGNWNRTLEKWMSYKWPLV